jgi:aerobic carbon-monoxide dehydrogenase small subunit
VSDLLSLKINGRPESVRVKPYDTLSRVLREELGMTGTKRGCDYGGCGACTVSLDGKAIYSCMYPVQYAEGKEILTVEGLAEKDETLSQIQQSFLTEGGLQCGYCTAGIMISTKCLLDRKPRPELMDIQEALAGNICRCTGYGRILESIFAAARAMSKAP